MAKGTVLGFLAGKRTVHLGITQHHPFRVVRLLLLPLSVRAGARAWEDPQKNSPRRQIERKGATFAKAITIRAHLAAVGFDNGADDG